MLAATLHKLMIWSHEYFMRLHLWIACFPHVNLCLTPWVVYTCKTVVMIDFLFLLEINADIYLNPTLHSALWKIGVKQMGKECRSDGCDAEGWVTPFSALCLQSCHLQPEHGHPPRPRVVGGKAPFPELSALIIFPDHFNMVTSSWASREGTKVPALVSAVSADWRICCGGWAGNWQESPSCAFSTPMQCTENQQGNGPGRLVPAVINGYPKIQGKPQPMLQNPFWECKRCFCFVVFFLNFFMFVVCRGLGGDGVCVIFAPPLGFHLLKHREGTLVYSIMSKRIVFTL